MKTERFDRFMERCLHHPEKGYYARNINGIGGRGDFTTAPELSDAPAKAIASWAANALREHGCTHLIEIGPGNGTLSKKVFRHLPLPLKLRTRLHLVESSPVLAKRQRQLHGKSARYHRDIFGAIDSCAGNAVIFSNELVDSFPVRLFEKRPDSWLEISVETSEGSHSEVLHPAKNLPPSSAFSENFHSGQRIEVHDSYRIWLESWLPLWKRGEMLTIDYGSTAASLYHRRPSGTLRGYLLNQRLEGPEIYRNQGLQDLTADVNFTDLLVWAERWTGPGEILNFANFIRPFSGSADCAFLAACEHFLLIRQKSSGRRTALPADWSRANGGSPHGTPYRSDKVWEAGQPTAQHAGKALHPKDHFRNGQLTPPRLMAKLRTKQYAEFPQPRHLPITQEKTPCVFQRRLPRRTPVRSRHRYHRTDSTGAIRANRFRDHR